MLNNGKITAQNEISAWTNGGNNYVENNGTVNSNVRMVAESETEIKYSSSEEPEQESVPGGSILVNNGKINASEYVDLVADNAGFTGLENNGEISFENNTLYGYQSEDGSLYIDNTHGIIDPAELTDDFYTNLGITETTEAVVWVNLDQQYATQTEYEAAVRNAVELYDLKDAVIVAAYPTEEGGQDVEILTMSFGPKPAEDDPSKDWEPSPYERLAHEMEEKRQAQAAGNVTASPWWGYQLYLGYASRNFWVRGKDGERIFHKSFTSFIPNEAGEDRKSLTLQVKSKDMTGVNIRFDESVLDVFNRVFIEQINVVNENNEPYMQYQVADLRAAREKYGLQPEELLLVGGTNDEVMRGTDHDGKFVSVESSEDAKEETAATEEVKEEAAETK